ncbi:MAG: AraC family transcriptional regulator [Alphaproteobacteria bacterium]|nr:AraC family transcriptional regulator [Alphaproteobacteria bacterium]
MPGSRASVFGEGEDFQAGLTTFGVARMLFTGRGQFQARLTQVELERLRLTAVEEAQPRIAFIAMPTDMAMIAFPTDGRPFPVWGGIEIRPGEMITFGPGERLHARTAGPCRWGAIQVPQRRLVNYGRVLSGTRFVVPPVARWRPRRAAVKQLHDLHRAAIRMAEVRATALTDPQAAHGLEQQVLDALIEFLSEEAEEEPTTGRRHRDILARFEDLLVAQPFLPMTKICAALGVPERTLRSCCKEHLGMGPSSYRRRHAMQRVYRALRSGDADMASVSEIARQYGFNGFGRLAANYRSLYGELPSSTLRRGMARD